MTKYLVQHRRGTVEQWAAQSTIIPREGEIVIEIDEVNSLHKLKIGDGIHTYAELAYLQAGDEIITQVLAEAKPRIVTVELTENWISDPNTEGKYSQVITLDNITTRSRLDLQPNADMLAEFKQLGLVFVTENKNGEITVYSVGNKPLKSYTMQATIVETELNVDCDEIVGTPVGVPASNFEQVQADWKQTDETAPDYIKNKLGLELGEAPKTTQQPGSLAISEGATAFGENNIAGLKSFEIVGWRKPATEGLSYELSDDSTYYICTGIGTTKDTDIVIPEEYNGLPVKEIAERAFYPTNGGMTSVVIPSSIISIGSQAFRHCYYLKTVVFQTPIVPTGILNANFNYVFWDCNIADLFVTWSEDVNDSGLGLNNGGKTTMHYNTPIYDASPIVSSIYNGTYTLSSPLSEEIPVGAEFGIQARLIYYRHGTITAISEDRLTVEVDNYIDIQAEIDKRNDPDIVKRFWLTDYPTAGDTDEGLYTVAAGSENLAGHFAATALGYGNKAIGKYSTALGRQTEAHYAALSAGYDTKALGEEAIALGYSSTAEAHRAVVIGQGLNANVNNQIVIGKFNAPADDAIFVVGNGTTKNATSNAFTVGFDGQVDITHEPTKDTSAINKKYVDTIEASIDTKVDELDNRLDTFQDRMANIEAGFITIDTDDGVIELPKMPEDEIIIGKIGGNGIEGINKIAPENIITGGAANGLGAQYTISGNDIIVTYANTTGGMFAIGIDIDVKPNTIYRLAFNRVESEVSIGVIYCYTDRLWGTSVNIYSPSKGTTKNTINFTGDYLTFDSGDNNHLVLGLYSAKNRASLTDVISNLILTEGEDEVAYVPYQILPSKTTSIKTYTASNSLITTYTVPSTIQNLPGYGHTDSIVDFLNKTYSYRTTDGKNYSSIPTVISIANIITEAPRITAESEGTVKFINSQNAAIDASILYKKEAETSKIEVIDNLNSTDSAAALSANMGRELSEKMVGYSNTYSSVGDDAWNKHLSISAESPSGSDSVLEFSYDDLGDARETRLSANFSSLELYDIGAYYDYSASLSTKNWGDQYARLNLNVTGDFPRSEATMAIDDSLVYISHDDSGPDVVTGGIKVGDAWFEIDSNDRSANDPEYYFSINNVDTATINGKEIATEDDIVTYTLSKSGSTITLTGSDGKTTSVTDSTGGDGITYTLEKSGTTISLKGSDGSVTSVTDSVGQTGDGEPNQNAFSNVTVQNSSGTTKFSETADSETDTLIIKEGNNITITDGGDDTIIISATANNTEYKLGKSGNYIQLLDASDDSVVSQVIDSTDGDGEINQNAFSYVQVGSTTIAADSKTDTLTLVAGSNITLTPDATNDQITISAIDTNTEYKLDKNNGNIRLLNAKTNAVVSQVADSVGNTEEPITYTLSKSGTTISLTGSDGSVTSVTDSVGQPGDGEPNQNAYSNVTVQNSSGVIKFTESADTETDTLIIKEGSNITITDGGDDTLIISATMPVMPSIVVTNNNPTLAWGTQSTVGTVDGTALTVIMPEKPDIEDSNTEYRLEKSNGYIQLINTKDSSVVSQVIDSVGGGPDGNTQYKLAKSGNYIQLLDASDNSVVSQIVDDKGNGEANVQSDWNVSDATSDAYIKNKPTKLSQFTNDANYITEADINNITGLSNADAVITIDLGNNYQAEADVYSVERPATINLSNMTDVRVPDEAYVDSYSRVNVINGLGLDINSVCTSVNGNKSFEHVFNDSSDIIFQNFSMRKLIGEIYSDKKQTVLIDTGIAVDNWHADDGVVFNIDLSTLTINNNTAQPIRLTDNFVVSIDDIMLGTQQTQGSQEETGTWGELDMFYWSGNLLSLRFSSIENNVNTGAPTIVLKVSYIPKNVQNNISIPKTVEEIVLSADGV